MAVERCGSWYEAGSAASWSGDLVLAAWSGSKSAATCSDTMSTALSAERQVIKNDKARKMSQSSRKRRVVRFKGVPRDSNEPAGGENNVDLPNGDVRLLRGFNDTEIHELNTVIALRNAKALAMSLGLNCRFAWPVLWCK